METFITDFGVDLYLVAGALAGVFSVLAFGPYVRDIWRGKTKPDRACWLIWSVLACISGASVLSHGAGDAGIYIWAQMLGTLIVFVLAFRFGEGPFFRRSNILILGVAGLGLFSWALMETAIYALIISIAVSALGGIKTMWKTYLMPESETASAWTWMLIAAAFGVYAATGRWDSGGGMVMAYPVYLLVLYAGIVVALVLGRRASVTLLMEEQWHARRLKVPPLRAWQPETAINPVFRSTSHRQTGARAKKVVWPLQVTRNNSRPRFAI